MVLNIIIHQASDCQKSYLEATGMALWVSVLVNNPNNLTSILRIHIVGVIISGIFQPLLGFQGCACAVSIQENA